MVDSSPRETVLSFKELWFNLFSGLMLSLSLSAGGLAHASSKRDFSGNRRSGNADFLI
jgi:hypothetical protein